MAAGNQKVPPFGHFLPGQCPNRLSTAVIARTRLSMIRETIGWLA
jgi:hypothetical protein